MKVIVLAGGLGSRLGSLGELMPKPMIEVGGKPMLWHIMKIYSSFGYNDFIICLGYKGSVIKDYFKNFRDLNSDFSVNLSNGQITHHTDLTEDWNVTLVDTGLQTLKGGRIKRIEDFTSSETNMLTYGDGVSDIDLNKLIKFHNSHDKIVTITGVRPPSMFGEFIENNNQVISFEEKPQTSEGLINGGFIVFDKEMFDYLTPKKDCDFEFGPLDQLVQDEQVMCYRHEGFWECADTIRDIDNLNRLFTSGNAPWIKW